MKGLKDMSVVCNILRMRRMPSPGALTQGHNLRPERVTVNSRLYVHIGIRPSTVVKFHQIPFRGEGAVAFTIIPDGQTGATPYACRHFMEEA